jgi:D-amino-acid dehydrogenase
MKIIVIGAGIVGLATTYWLARDGHSLMVVDRAPAVGEGASFANGGQLSYDYVAPLADPSVLAKLPSWLISGNSPVKFRPAADPGQYVWMLSFLMACTAGRSRATTESLLALAHFSRQALDELIELENIEFLHRRSGKIVFYSDGSSFRRAVRQQLLQAELGTRQMVLSRDECIDLEPSLAQSANRIVGAIYTPTEELGDCRLTCEALRQVLERPPYRVEFRLSSQVFELIAKDNRLVGIRIPEGVLEADIFVLSAGIGSRSLAKNLGLHLPLYPIRGYSISTPIVDSHLAPQRSITDYDRRIVFAPIGEIVRAAGFADIVTPSAPIDNGRIAALRRAVEDLFPGACRLTEIKPWTGSRPATPSGSPIIGPTRWRNLFVNVGQGALGYTLAAGSGRMLADIIAGRGASVNEVGFALTAA